MRRFGLEVEFSGDLLTAITSLRSAGLNVEDGRSSHLGFSQTAWRVKRDGSVSRGGELVSPPLDFDDPEQREQVTKAVQALQDAGCRPDPSAGIHVHIEAVNENGFPLTGKQIAAIVRFTYKFEDAIYRIASSGWQTIRPGARTFAKPIPEPVARAIMEARTEQDVRNVWNGYRASGRARAGSRFNDNISRYCGTNVRAWMQGKGTIEFRYFNSSVNPMRVQTYIALCMAIVQDARNGYSRSVTKSYRLGGMAAGAVSEDAVLLRLQQILRSNSRDTKICMEKEDWKNLRKLWKNSRPQRNVFSSSRYDD